MNIFKIIKQFIIDDIKLAYYMLFFPGIMVKMIKKMKDDLN